MKRAAAALALVAVGCKTYPVTVRLTPAAADRRLASGKAETIEGVLDRADAANYYVRDHGDVQTVPRADVAEVDQRLAKRDVRIGAVATGAGALLVIGGTIAFECGKNDFPLFCSLSSKRNLYASVAFLGGIALAGLGLGALVGGISAQSDVDARLKRQASRWHVAPTVVQGDRSIGPGVGLARY